MPPAIFNPLILIWRSFSKPIYTHFYSKTPIALLLAFIGCDFPIPAPPPNLFNKSHTVTVGSGPVYLLTDDLNLDSVADIISINSKGNSISLLYGHKGYRNPTTLATQAEPSMAAVGDLNNDGIPDLIVNSKHKNALNIFMGIDGSSFKRARIHKTGRVPVMVILDDFNNDGRLDAAVALTFHKLEIHLGDGHGRLKKGATYSTGSTALSGVAGDFDDDGNRDIALAVTSPNASAIRIFSGIGDGTFQQTDRFAQGLMPLALIKRDMNSDGREDLIAASGKGDNLYLFYANEDGSFSQEIAFSAGGGPIALTAGHFNDDNHRDVAVANSRSSSFSVVFRKANGRFGFPSRDYVVEGGVPLAITSGDYNHDRRQDIAVAGNYSNKVEIYLRKNNRQTKP